MLSRSLEILASTFVYFDVKSRDQSLFLSSSCTFATRCSYVYLPTITNKFSIELVILCYWKAILCLQHLLLFTLKFQYSYILTVFMK